MDSLRPGVRLSAVPYALRSRRVVREARARLEEIAVAVLALGLTAYAEWSIMTDSLTFQSDARLHEFWMRRFQDEALFQDPLTDALLETGYSPLGWRALYWLASHVIDPVRFGELLPLVLVPLSAWLVFRITRAATSWAPAAWIASALFLLPWDLHRFSGGHPRAFAYPIVLLTVLLLVKKRSTVAALVPPVGFLFYPPAGLVALGVLLLSSLAWKGGLRLTRGQVIGGLASVALLVLAALLPRLLTGNSPDLLTEAEARQYPEFGERGQLHFFASSVLKVLSQNYSGFDLRASGSILVVAGLALLLIRWRNALLLPWPVWAMPLSAIFFFGVAHLLLFRLYLPHRYTYPLIPFFCILIGVAWRPTWAALASRIEAGVGWHALVPTIPLALGAVGLTIFPFGPLLGGDEFLGWFERGWPYLVTALAAGLALAAVLASRSPPDQKPGSLRATSAAITAGVLLMGMVGVAGAGTSPAETCTDAPLLRYLATLPKDAVVAGNPMRLNCVPIVSRRAVVINRKLYQPWEREYFRVIRERMLASIRGYYGSSEADLAALRERYGADFLVVEGRLSARSWRDLAPFSGLVRQALGSPGRPAVRRLPSECRTWREQGESVYDLACVVRSGSFG